MPHQSKAPTEAWRSPLLTDRLGLRQQHESGRLQQDDWKPQAHQKRSDGFSAYGGGGNQRVGPGWDDARLDGIGECELVIGGVRWVEINGEWQPEEEAPRTRPDNG